MKLGMRLSAAIKSPSLFPSSSFTHLSASTSLPQTLPASIFSSLLTPISGRNKLFLRAQNLACESVEQMDLKKEFPELKKDLYPSIEPYSTGFLEVSDLHTIYWEQSGNPNGHPVVFLHGGPGGGTSPNNRRFFDPVFYRIILFDQRGAGKSKPHACLEENTTWDLVGDIEKLREHLNIPEWQVFGGSWGSTLALTYSISHPDKVTGIILRGIFLLRKKEIDWFYEGGAAAIFPDDWEPFRDLIPEEERKCFVKAYHKRLNSDEPETQFAAARAWTKWEMMTSHLLPNEENIKRGDDDNFSLAFARIENHYFINNGFFSSDSFLLDNVEKIKHIKTIIVQEAMVSSAYILSCANSISGIPLGMLLFRGIGLATNLEVEATAAWKALSYGIEKGFPRVQIQTDSLALKYMLDGLWKVPWELVELIEHTQQIMQKLVVSIIQIFREANQLADFIVNEAFKHEEKLQSHNLLQLPTTARGIINTNKNQILVLRVRTRPIAVRVA